MSFRFCTDKNDVAKNVYEVDQELGGGELSLSACAGVGNRPPRKKKITNPRGCAPGGMVTSKIEPCIIRLRANERNNFQHCCANTVRICFVRVGSGVQTDATTPNNVGTCRASWEGYNP